MRLNAEGNAAFESSLSIPIDDGGNIGGINVTFVVSLHEDGFNGAGAIGIVDDRCC